MKADLSYSYTSTGEQNSLHMKRCLLWGPGLSLQGRFNVKKWMSCRQVIQECAWNNLNVTCSVANNWQRHWTCDSVKFVKTCDRNLSLSCFRTFWRSPIFILSMLWHSIYLLVVKQKGPKEFLQSEDIRSLAIRPNIERWIWRKPSTEMEPINVEVGEPDCRELVN